MNILKILISAAAVLIAASASASVSIKKIPERALREIAAMEGEYGEFSYMIDFLDHLRSCGITGEIVQIMGAPEENLPDIRGLHLLVRAVEMTSMCFSGHWRMLDNPLERHRLRRIVRSDQLVFIALETLRHFHSVVADPENNKFAGLVRRSLARETDPAALIFLGRQAVFDDPVGNSLTDDLLELSSWHLKPAALLATLELVSRARRAEVEIPEESPTLLTPETGVIEVKSEPPDPDAHVLARPRQVRTLISAFRGATLSSTLIEDLAELLSKHMRAEDVQMLKSELQVECATQLTPRSRHH